MDNASGGNDICELFKTKYYSLYNSSIYDCTGVANLVTNAVSTTCSNDCATVKHLHNIQPAMVADAIKKLKKHSYDKLYDVSAYNLVHGTNKLNTLISLSFTAFLCHGLSPTLLNSSYLVPIPKNYRASLSNSDNYRAIALNTLFNKLMDYIFIESLKDDLQTSDFQFAYKDNFSTTLCSFLAMETIHHFNEKGSKVLAVFLDASKAFDKVEHAKLFSVLLNKNICPLIVRYLFKSYSISKLSVKWGVSESSSFSQGNGVKQGAVLSPMLFAIYLDPLINRLRDCGAGCHIGNTSTNVFGYADDLLLLAPTYGAMKELLNICEEYGVEFNLTFNPNKSSLIMFNPPGWKVIDKSITFLGKSIPLNYTEKHLGHLLSTSWFKPTVDFGDSIRDLRCRVNVILKEFSHLNTWARVKLFNSQCLSLYGCELWDLRNKDLDKLSCEWRKCSRRILGVDPRTHNLLIPALMSTPALETLVYSRIMSFCIKGLNHPSGSIKFLFQNALQNSGSPFSNNVKTICHKLGMSVKDACSFTVSKIKSLVKKSFKCDVEPAVIQLITELIDIRDGQLFCIFSPNEINDCLSALCTG